MAEPSVSETIAVSILDLGALAERHKHLTAQVQELQAAASARAEEGLPRRVRAFHAKFGHPVASTPQVPDEAQVRFRLNLIAEEFFELLDAALGPGPLDVDAEESIFAAMKVRNMIASAKVQVNLPEFVDALGDLDFVIEGTRAVFGVNGQPVMDEIYRANMAKDPIYVTAKDDHHRSGNPLPTFPDATLARLKRPDPTAKPTKPADWRAPDIEAVLVKQGWIPTVHRGDTEISLTSPGVTMAEHREIEPNGQQKAYVVLSDAERAKGFVEPVRTSYRHVGTPDGSKKGCGTVTSMGTKLCETYARDPGFYTATFCSKCKDHFLVGASGEFVWEGTSQRVGTRAQSK